MTVLELTNMNPQQVRSNENLMRIYISLYVEQFGKVPNCAGCNFNSDFERLKKTLSLQNTTKKTEMKNSIILKIKGNEILSFVKDGIKHRCYSNLATDDFFKDYLTYGTIEEIESRKKIFVKLPKNEVIEVIQDNPIEKKTRIKKRR